MSNIPQLRISRELPIRHDVDVCVIGGGPAGVAAAIAAARQGRSVYLAEGQVCFGGMGTAGMIPAYMEFADGVNFVAAGIGREIYDRLWKAGGNGPFDSQDNPKRYLSIRAEVLKRVYDEMVAEAGVDFTFQTQLIGVEMRTPGLVDYAICSGKSGLFAVKAKIFIDGTGDGDPAAWAGAPFAKGDDDGNLMPGTLCSLWADIDWPAARATKVWAQQLVPQAIEDGVFTNPDRHLPGMWAVGTHVGGGNIGHSFGVDGTDERSLTPALLWGRKVLQEYERFYKGYVKGYEQMELVATASLMGIRETRRILGDYTLVLDDFVARAVFADEIGRYSYPVDIHASKPDAKSFAQFEHEMATYRFKPGESYGIPYRTLTPQGLQNVLVAGRCISTDRPMQASVRVMPGCYITGQAAGIAAALAVAGDTDTRGIDIAELQARLRAMGGFLPN